MSEQYPSTMHPKSHTTSSLRPITRSEGRAWGFAPFGPAAMIGSKLLPLAPRSRMANSSSSANWRSVIPASRRANIDWNASSAIAQAARTLIDLARVLHPA
jgi:hypothetical protein